jgi:hypothetical protein
MQKCPQLPRLPAVRNDGAFAPSEGRKRAAAALGRSGAGPRAPSGGWQRYSADWGYTR